MTQVLTTDRFGRAVAAHLEALAGGAVTTVEDRADLVPDGGPVVLAASRPVLAEARAMDAMAFERGMTWLPAWCVESDLVVGPLVVPGAGPCFGCFERRERQLAHSLGVFDAVAELRTSPSPDLAVLPPVARLAAATIVQVLTEVDAGRWEPGVVTSTSLAPAFVRRATTRGWHACPRCDPEAEAASTSSFRELHRAVQGTLAQPAE